MTKKKCKMDRWRYLDGLLSKGAPLTQYDIFLSYQKNRDFRMIQMSDAQFDKLGSMEKADRLALYNATFRKDIDLFKKTLKKHHKEKMLEIGRGAAQEQFGKSADFRTKTYCYSQKGFSIIPLVEDEMSDGEFRSLTSVVEKLKGVLNDTTFQEVRFAFRSRIEADYEKGNNCVDYEDNRRLKGREYRPVIYNAIQKKQILHINYRTFKGEKFDFDFYPFLLKQYNDRWFAFGNRPDVLNPYTNVPLDRLDSVPLVVGEHDMDTPDHYLDYFADIVGVTKMHGERKHIVIGIHDIDTWGRVTTKPLVSQDWDAEKGFDTENNYGQIWLDVIPNNELYSKILSWGPSAEIESPPLVREHIKKLITELGVRYD